MRKVCQIIAAGGLIAGLAAPASATTITFATQTGATNDGGDPVDASATFKWLGDGSLTITLDNLLANPKNVAQALSALVFTVSDSALTTGTMTTSMGTPVAIDGNGHTTPGTAGPTGWKESFSSGAFHLDDLSCGCSGPADLIIGAPNSSGVYSNANSSIAGNGPHNPFLSKEATFTLSIPLTLDETITGVRFQFGTTSGINEVLGLGGTPQITSTTPVPEPASLLLLGSGLIGAGVRRRRTHSTAA